jgi:ketosteroid isomerase-like protein
VSEAEETNKALVRRFLEAHAEGDQDALEGLLAPDFVNRSALSGQGSDREGYLRSAAGYHAAFSTKGVMWRARLRLKRCQSQQNPTCTSANIGGG